MSKLCPSDTLRPVTDPADNSPPAVLRRPPRVFRNFYTRAGRRYWTNGWVVKLQYRGERRTISLRATSKNAAVVEASAVAGTLFANGWEAVRRTYERPRGDVEEINWQERVLARRYGFPASGSREGALAVRIEHAGIGGWFPLGTSDASAAAAKAARIHQTLTEQGWDECCRCFSRELIVGFEWCANPILWTYATVHTLVEGARYADAGAAVISSARPIVIVEEDPGVRRALEWCIKRQVQHRCIGCDSTLAFHRISEKSKPALVLLNRKLAERLGFASPGRMAVLLDGVPAVTYSLASDGDQLFVSTPGGAEGYLLKRVKPERLLEPILQGSPRLPDLAAEEFLPRVKSFFKELLHPRVGQAGSAVERLTRRENEVLGLLSKGCVDKEIAQALGISAWTVHGHIKSIFERLGVRTRTEAVVRYLEK